MVVVKVVRVVAMDIFLANLGARWRDLGTFWHHFGHAPFFLFVCRRRKKGASVFGTILSPTRDPLAPFGVIREHFWYRFGIPKCCFEARSKLTLA